MDRCDNWGKLSTEQHKYAESKYFTARKVLARQTI